MLELAIAEAYRPCPSPSSNTPPRPPSFATNPNARASTFSLRSRPPSALSRTLSAASRPRSFRSFIARRKRVDSVVRERVEGPGCGARSDSVFSSPIEEQETHAMAESAMVQRELPDSAPNVPLPPQEDLGEFDAALQAAIEDLQVSPATAAHDLNLSTLSHLAHVADLAACVATSWDEFWGMLVHAARLLSSVLPTRHALMSSLAQVAVRWHEQQENGGESGSTAEIARITGEAFEEAISLNRTRIERLGVAFACWTREYCDDLWTQSISKVDSRADSMCPDRIAGIEGDTTLRLLTLSTSHATFAALTHALSSSPHLTMSLSILSLSGSHPDPPLLPDQLPSLRSRLRITTNSTSTIRTAGQEVDMLLLEAECIDFWGNVRCRKGALDTAVCVKMLSPSAKVVVLSDTNSLTTVMTVMGSAAGVKADDAAQSFELVPARFVDVYVAETGVLGIGDLQKLAKKAGELERHIFGDEYDQ